jgi:hypothetical protein
MIPAYPMVDEDRHDDPGDVITGICIEVSDITHFTVCHIPERGT